MEIFDDDSIGKDYIGRAIIHPSDAAISNNSDVPTPRWHPVKMRQDGPPQGEILVSFSIVAADFIFERDSRKLIEQKVNTEEFQIDINILGLRELQSSGILPVKKAFVSFNLKSLVSPA